MPISSLPDEILDLTFKELIPPFRSEALTEIYVFDTPVDLLRLRLVSKRLSRIATPLAWRRVQLRISASDIVMLEAKKSWRWRVPMGRGEDFTHSSSSPYSTSTPSQFNPLQTPPPPPPLHFLFFQDHPELAAHVRVLSLSVEYQSEESGSDPIVPDGDDSDTESEFGLGRRGVSSMTATTTAPVSSSSSSSSQYLAHALRAATHGMSGLRTVLLWDHSATPSGVAFSSARGDPSGAAPGTLGLRLGSNAVLAREIMSLFLRVSLMKVLSLRDVDGAAFSSVSEPDNGRIESHSYRRSSRTRFSAEENSRRFDAELEVARGFTRQHQQRGLKMLHLSNTRCPAQVITSLSTRGSLEVLSIELAKSERTDFEDETAVNHNSLLAPPTNSQTPTLRDIPWSTLKEVSLSNCVDKRDWTDFLSGFKLHPHPTALTELLISDLSGLPHPRLTQLLHTFSPHPLSKLTLFYLPLLDPLTTARIVRAFPHLTSLTLLTEGELAPWHGGAMDDYAQTLALLPHLETLGWNNFHLRGDGHGADAAAFLAMREEDNAALTRFYARAVGALTRRARRLRCVRFVSVEDCVVDSVFVGGSSKLRFEDGPPRLIVRRSNEAALHTSSWDTSPGRLDDF